MKRKTGNAFRILLVQAPLSSEELFMGNSEQSASIIPPLGLAYIASTLRENGYECRIIDGIVENVTIDQIVNIAKSYDIVGITAVSSYVLRPIQLIKELKNVSSCPWIIVGGPHVTVLPESLLRTGADFAVIGEGEKTMLELVNYLSRCTPNAKDLENIKGIGFLNGDTYQYTGRREWIEPLDWIPTPAYDLLPMHLYHSSIARDVHQPALSLFTSRGCPGICSFCSKRTFGTHIRYFSVDRIVSEFFLLRDKYGARSISIWDDNFTSNLDIVHDVCEELIRRNFNLPFSVEARIDSVTPETLRLLKRAGCSYIAYGIESGSQRILDYINKNITLDQIRHTITITKQAKLPMRGYFILGFPSETISDIEKTIQFAIELDIDVASFTLLIPLPGTLEYNRAKLSGTFDPLYFEKFIIPEFNFPNRAIYVPEGMTENELLRIHKKAYNKYYYRPSIIIRRISSIRSIDDVKAMVKGGSTLLANFFGNK